MPNACNRYLNGNPQSGPYYGSLRPEFSVYILAPYDGMHSITLTLESHKAIGHNLEKCFSSVIS